MNKQINTAGSGKLITAVNASYGYVYTRVGILIVATIYLQLIQNRYMFRRFTVLNIVTSIVYNRCQRCGSRRIPLAAPVVLIVRMERSTL